MDVVEKILENIDRYGDKVGRVAVKWYIIYTLAKVAISLAIISLLMLFAYISINSLINTISSIQMFTD